MDKSKALELLKQELTEIPNLKKLHYNNQEFKLWCARVETIIKEGLDADDYNRLDSVQSKYFPDELAIDLLSLEEDYLPKLNDYKIVLKSIIQKYKILGIEEKLQGEGVNMEHPKVFIAHGGDSPALRKLESYLEALGVQPLIVEEQPSEGRSITENVDYYARQADCAIILATKGDVDGKTGGFIPRGNVLIEIGKLQEIFKERIVYLLQAGTKLPTNISEKVRVRFSPQSMDNSFIKIAQELKKYEILGIEPQIATKAEPKVATTELPTYLFDKMQFHSEIVSSCESLFKTGHYAQAIFEAFKAVENFVKQKTGLPVYGKQLMAQVFNEENPLIKVTEAGRFDKDVQEGFKFLFMGATVGIRNPKAHQKVIQKDPFITLEYLGFASFLIKRIEG